MTKEHIRKFWKEYKVNDSFFDRRDKLKTLPFFKDLKKILESTDFENKENLHLLEYLLVSTFQSYIDDSLEISSIFNE